jgi:hypothetical protein
MGGMMAELKEFIEAMNFIFINDNSVIHVIKVT